MTQRFKEKYETRSQSPLCHARAFLTKFGAISVRIANDPSLGAGRVFYAKFTIEKQAMFIKVAYPLIQLIQRRCTLIQAYPKFSPPLPRKYLKFFEFQQFLPIPDNS